MILRSLFKTLASHNTLCNSFGYKTHSIVVNVNNLEFKGDSINDFINNVIDQGYTWELAYKILDLEVKTGKNPMVSKTLKVSLVKNES